jgi:S-adenosylmethionine:tRNA ribosyltransferase-isomerase
MQVGPVSSVPPIVLHVSTGRPEDPQAWIVELRTPRPDGSSDPRIEPPGAPGTAIQVAGGAKVTLLQQHTGRLWVAALDLGTSVARYLSRHGRPIRYHYVDCDWPLATYQTVFATIPGSAEMLSAARPFTPELVTRLVSAGIGLVPITLHTGVASPEAHERPYAEWFSVSETTAELVNHARACGRRVIAVGTTTVRALESAAGDDGTIRAACGWTDLVITPERGVRAIDGLLTGLHEPTASHRQILAAVAGLDLVQACYTEALDKGYLWHEFGDANLLLARCDPQLSANDRYPAR